MNASLRNGWVTRFLRLSVGMGCLFVLGTAVFLPDAWLIPVVLTAVVLLSSVVWLTTTALDRLTLKEQKAEADAAFERHLLRSLLDTIPDSVYFKDADSRFLLVSKSQAERFGLTDPVAAIGKSDVEFFGEEHARRARADELYVMRTGNPLIGKEEKATTPGGEERWVLSTKLPLRDPAGRLIGTFGISRDITQRKRAEEALRQGQERYQTLIEVAAAIVWSTPASGEFEEPQLAWSEFTGQSFDELRGWGWLEAVHPEERLDTTRVWSNAVSSRSVYQTEHRLRRRDGVYRRMVVRAVPIFAQDGQIREWVGVHTDVEAWAEAIHREKRESLETQAAET